MSDFDNDAMRDAMRWLQLGLTYGASEERIRRELAKPRSDRGAYRGLVMDVHDFIEVEVSIERADDARKLLEEAMNKPLDLTPTVTDRLRAASARHCAVERLRTRRTVLYEIAIDSELREVLRIPKTVDIDELFNRYGTQLDVFEREEEKK